MFKSKLTAEQEARIIEVYLAGNSLGRTGDMLGLTISSVLGALERNHVPRRPPSTSGGYKGKAAVWVRTPCAECGTPVKRRESEMRQRTTGRVFCSEHSTRGKKPRRRKVRACSVCGVEFYPMGLPDQQCCSKRCLGLSQRRRYDKQCEQCGESFTVKKSQGKQKFCSKRCEGTARMKRKIGRDHNGKPALMDPFGYIKVWEPKHPDAIEGWMREHRLVAERTLGRRLLKTEVVHHLNHDRADNRPENLEVLGSSEHSMKHEAEVAEKLRRLAEYERRFGPLS